VSDEEEKKSASEPTPSKKVPTGGAKKPALNGGGSSSKKDAAGKKGIRSDDADAPAPQNKSEPGGKKGIGSKKGIATPSTPSKKGLSTPSKKGVASTTPSSKKRVPEPAAAAGSNKTLIFAAGGVLVVAVLVAIIVVVSGGPNNSGGGNNPDGPTPVASSSGDPSARGEGNTPTVLKRPNSNDGGSDTPANAAADTTPAVDLNTLTPEERKEREDLTEKAGEIKGLAMGDEFMRAKALKMCSVLRTSASAKNMDIVNKTEAYVKERIQIAQRAAAKEMAEANKHAAEEEAKKQAEAKQKADEDAKKQPSANNPDNGAGGPLAPEPPPPPNPSVLAYLDFQKKFNPAIAAFDFDKAKQILGEAPELEGAPAKDLEDDKAALGVLQKLIDYAGAPKAWKDIIELEEQTFILAKGDKIVGTLKKVENNTLTIFMKIGGLADYKIAELALKDVCAYARKGCPKEERQNCFVGWGLAVYYAGDLDTAKGKFEESLKEQGTTGDLAKRFLSRIVREKIVAGKGQGSSEPPPSKPVAGGGSGGGAGGGGGTPPNPNPAPSPDAPATPEGGGPDLTSLKENLHGATVTAEAGGKVFVNYSCTQDSMREDFSVQGNATIGRSDTFYANWGLYFGISSNDSGQFSHCLTWKGDFDWTIEYMLNTSIRGPDQLAFKIDMSEGKKTRGLFALLGQIFGKFEGTKMTQVGGAFDQGAFGAERRYTIRFVRKGDDFTLYFNGGKRATTKMAGADARFTFASSGCPIWITKLEMHGTPNQKK
jgi:hypothetical protein